MSAGQPHATLNRGPLPSRPRLGGAAAADGAPWTSAGRTATGAAGPAEAAPLAARARTRLSSPPPRLRRRH
eukprot:349769-Chlamydomonas_euryale.AAC.1